MENIHTGLSNHYRSIQIFLKISIQHFYGNSLWSPIMGRASSGTICRQRKKQKAPQQSCCNNTVRFHSAAGQWDTQPSPIPSILLFATWPMCACVWVLSLGFRLRSIHLISMVDETTHGSPLKMAWRDNFIRAGGGGFGTICSRTLVSWCTRDLILLDHYHILKKMLHEQRGLTFTIWLSYMSSGIN